jgi:hypothetical protein
MAQDYCSATAMKPSDRLGVIDECRALLSVKWTVIVCTDNGNRYHTGCQMYESASTKHIKRNTKMRDISTMKLLERFQLRHYEWARCQKNAILVHWSLTASSLYLTSIGCHFLPARLSYYCSRVNATLTRVWWKSGGERPLNDSCRLK